jgi:hypothetical protein
MLKAQHNSNPKQNAALHRDDGIETIAYMSAAPTMASTCCRTVGSATFTPGR